MPSCVIRKTNLPNKLTCDWSAPAWQLADPLSVDRFRLESGVHRPRTEARLLYDDNGIHGLFRVKDRFVRCVRDTFQSEVWKDSCVEFFVQPKGDKGYFNFEFNCGGALVCNYITDHQRVPGGFKAFIKLPYEHGKYVRVVSSLPRIIEPEITEPVTWSLQFFIPFNILANYVGDLGEIAGSTWRGNFFKCADESSHPHWASWSEVDEFNFHLPRCFGSIYFEP